MKKLRKLATLIISAILLTLLASCSSGGDSKAAPTPDASASKYRVLSETLAEEEYAIGFRKQDAALTNLVNDTLKEMKADGSLGAISTDWFGSDITIVGISENDVKLDVLPDDKSDERSQLILGFDASFPPMGYTDDSGNYVGFDLDVAKALCDKLGWELILMPIEWAAKEMELNSGSIDCIWNGMTVTPERAESMSLSTPYMRNSQVLVVMSDTDYKTKADLAGKKVALQAGSSAEDALNSDAAFKDSLGGVNTFGDNMYVMMDIEQGSSDAALLDSIVANFYITDKEK